MRFLVRVDGGCREAIERALRTKEIVYEPTAEGLLIADENKDDGFPTFEIATSTIANRAENTLDSVIYDGDDDAFVERLRATMDIASRVALCSPYRRILDACPVRVFVQSSEGEVLYANAQSHQSVAPSSSGSEEVEPWTRSVEELAEFDGAFVTPRANGWQKTTKKATRLDGQSVVVGVTTDISTDRAAREEMEIETQMLRGLIDAIPNLVFVSDEDERVVLANAALARYLGRESSFLADTTIDDFARDAHSLEQWRDARARARVSDAEEIFEIDGLDANGVLYARNGSVRLTRSPNGQQWLLTVITDVSDLRRAQKEAESARNLAESASRVKSRFLANMSHEIRTPMNGVLGMLDLALATKLTTEQADYLESAKISADSLLAIINDILDISKIEAGRLNLETIPFSIKDVVDALAPLRAQAREKGLTTHVVIAPDVHEHVMGDPIRFRQILVNLVGNAVKFTKHGKIDVRVSMDEAAPDTVHVAVADTGIGISKSDQVALFEPFRQADETTTRKFGGTGLGLSICRQLTNMMGGTIWIDSELGCGSTFHFTARLPKTAASAVIERTPEKPVDFGSSKKVRVLLAEDNPIGAKLAKKVLELEHCDVVHAVDGAEALKLATSSTFDLILMDMQMPVMDGLESTTKIRADERASGRHVPIFALTANAMRGDAEICVAAGMDGHLAKPLERPLLRQVIERARRDATSEPAKKASIPVPTRAPAVDVDEALERCGGDPELLAEVAAAFIESFQSNVAALHAAVAATDGTAIYKAAHALKGVFAYLSAHRGAELAQGLCNSGRDGNVPRAKDLLKELCDEGIAIREILDEVGVKTTAA